jgi:hypothetical protein
VSQAEHIDVERALEDLLSRAAHDVPLRREEIDRVLTDGYAEALGLEVQRLECSRRLDSLRGTEEAEQVSAELRACTRRLVELRGRLAEVSRRFGRNPLAD